MEELKSIKNRIVTYLGLSDIKLGESEKKFILGGLQIAYQKGQIDLLKEQIKKQMKGLK